jgi:hypothetical protein
VIESAIHQAVKKEVRASRALNTSKHGSTTFAEFYESSTVAFDNNLSGWLPVDSEAQFKFADRDPLPQDAMESSVQEDCNTLFSTVRTIARKSVTSVYHDTHATRYLDGRKPDCTFTLPSWLPSPLSVVLLGELTVCDFTPGMFSF